MRIARGSVSRDVYQSQPHTTRTATAATAVIRKSIRDIVRLAGVHRDSARVIRHDPRVIRATGGTGSEPRQSACARWRMIASDRVAPGVAADEFLDEGGRGACAVGTSEAPADLLRGVLRALVSQEVP